jgi:pimeloyl-ACP methyl ester carboxylesterase
MREGWIDRGSTRLHYLQWDPVDAPRAPALLLLHGLGSNARYWERVAAHLPRRRLVALDQRCHGLSDCPRYGYSHRTLAGDAAAVIAELGLGRPLVVGHSWGAVTALETAVRHPGLVAGLVQLDGGSIGFSDLMTWEVALQVMHRPMPTYASIKEAIAERRAELPGAWADDLDRFVAAGVAPADGGYRPRLTMPARRQLLRGMYDQRPEALWARVGCQVMLGLGGSADQGPFLAIKRQGAERLAELRPDAEIHWYEGPHDFPLYLAASVAADLDAFAERCGAEGARGAAAG